MPEEPPSPDNGLLIGALRIPYSVTVQLMERGLSAAGYEGVRAAHLTVIQPLWLRPAGARTTDLAAWAHITKPSMVYLVDHLEAQGYVERTADPSDGRAQRVRLTPQGVELTRTVRRLIGEIEEDWERRIGAAQVAQLKQLLSELVASLRGREDEK